MMPPETTYTFLLLACAEHMPISNMRVFPRMVPLYRCALGLACVAPVAQVVLGRVQYHAEPEDWVLLGAGLPEKEG